MRGEDLLRDFPSMIVTGSPPHARGRLLSDIVIEPTEGITPACAGKTKRSSMVSCSSSDHPRMRGEDASNRGTSLSPRGSPPHARGRRGSHGVERPEQRITPACAGKTFVNWVRDWTVPDHPRMRGEDWSKPLSNTGSTWITPAWAGKTLGQKR